MGVSFTLSPRSLPLSEDPTATVSLVVQVRLLVRVSRGTMAMTATVPSVI